MLKPAQAGQTALSGSQIKPPALPEIHDFRYSLLVESSIRFGKLTINEYTNNECTNNEYSNNEYSNKD